MGTSAKHSDAGRVAAPGAGLSDDHRARQTRLLGLMAAFVLLSFFVYPIRPYPVQGLIFIVVLGVFALSVTFHGFRFERSAFVAALANPGAVALAAFGAWSLVRWQGLEVPAFGDPEATVRVTSPGRPRVVAYELMIAGLLFGLGLASMGRDSAPSLWRVFRRSMIVAAIGFSLYGIYQYVEGYERAATFLRDGEGAELALPPLMRQSLENAFAERRVGGRLGNGNVFAALLSVLAAFSLSGWMRPASMPWRVLGTAGYLLSFATIVLTRSRGGMLTFILATAGALAILWRTSRSGAQAGASSSGTDSGGGSRAGSAQSAAAGAAMAAIFALGARAAMAEGFWSRIGNAATIRERFNYWRVALDVWAMNRLAGASPGAFELYYPRFKPPTARESQYAHSWLLQTGAETGWIGVALMAVFWLSALAAILGAWKIVAARPGSEDAEAGETSAPAEALWLGLGCLLLAFNGLFEYSLALAEFLILLGALGGGLLGLSFWWRPARTPERASGSERAAGHEFAWSGGARLTTVRASACAAMILAVLAAAAWMVPRYQIGTFWEWEARFASQANDFRTAVPHYEHATRWIPDDPGFLASMAIAVAYSENDDPKAERLILKAVAMNPISARLRQVYALFYQMYAEDALAVEKLDEAVELYPFDGGLRLERAKARLNVKLIDKAEEDLDFIVEQGLPLWEFEVPAYEGLRQRIGISERNAMEIRRP